MITKRGRASQWAFPGRAWERVKWAINALRYQRLRKDYYFPYCQLPVVVINTLRYQRLRKVQKTSNVQRLLGDQHLTVSKVEKVGWTQLPLLFALGDQHLTVSKVEKGFTIDRAQRQLWE